MQASKAMTEEWRLISLGIFAPQSHYEVSDLGRVRNHDTGKVLKSFFVTNRSGERYEKVNLWKGNRRFPRFVHRLVAQAFIANLEQKPEVNHFDENTLNNCKDNLEWATRVEQEAHKRFMRDSA